MTTINHTAYLAPAHFYDGTVVPELMTEEEAIKFLRLDSNSDGNGKESLKRLREHYGLQATKGIGKTLKYQKKELLKFIDTMTEKTAQREKNG